MNRVWLPGTADPGRVLVLAATVLMFGSATFWLWVDPLPGYDVAHGLFEWMFGVALALCALPLLSRRHRRALAVVAAIGLLAWSLLASYFGGLVMLPEVVVLLIAAAPRPPRREFKRAHQPT